MRFTEVPQPPASARIWNHIGRNYRPNISTLDDVSLETHQPMHSTRLGNNPQATLGTFELFPTEVLYMILDHLDPVSLSVLRRVNRKGTSLVDSQPTYSTIMRYCPNVIRAAVAIRAKFFTLEELYITLLEQTCYSCGESMGNFLHLALCRRICQYCIFHSSCYLPLDTTRLPISDRANPDEAKWRGITAVPGRYGMDEVWDGDRERLFFPNNAEATLYFDGVIVDDDDRYDHWRYTCVVSVPNFDVQRREFDWGFTCRECYWELQNDKHTLKALPEHLLEEHDIVDID